MGSVLESYRAVHEQGFVPIFVKDEYQTAMLVEACLAAGVRAIEYTLRRPDAREMIPWIRKRYPDLVLLAGSTLDDERIVSKMRTRYPQLMTLKELADLGVDGFVSMMGLSQASLERYATTHLLIPTAETVTQALQQVGAGAHMAKVDGQELDLARRCRRAPAFDFCALFITGGITLERIPEAVAAGGIVLATGFDVMTKGRSGDMGCKHVTDVLCSYMKATAAARCKAWPEMMGAVGKDAQTWLNALPHFHPF